MPSSQHNAGLRTRAWQQFRKAVIRESDGICGICGQPVDLSLPGTHRDGPHVHHRIPLNRGGRLFDRRFTQLTHNRCNAARSDKLEEPVHSRIW